MCRAPPGDAGAGVLGAGECPLDQVLVDDRWLGRVRGQLGDLLCCAVIDEQQSNLLGDAVVGEVDDGGWFEQAAGGLAHVAAGVEQLVGGEGCRLVVELLRRLLATMKQLLRVVVDEQLLVLADEQQP